MKVEVIKTAKKEIKPFPKLMVTSNDVIVLFLEPRVGTIIDPFNDTGQNIGMHAKNWDMDDFSDFEGSVTLSND